MDLSRAIHINYSHIYHIHRDGGRKTYPWASHGLIGKGNKEEKGGAGNKDGKYVQCIICRKPKGHSLRVSGN